MFDFILAEKLGGMTVDEMRQRVSNHEWTHWKILHQMRAQQRELEVKLRGR